MEEVKPKDTSRRTLLSTAAWSLPAVTVMASVPLAAASSPDPTPPADKTLAIREPTTAAWAALLAGQIWARPQLQMYEPFNRATFTFTVTATPTNPANPVLSETRTVEVEVRGTMPVTVRFSSGLIAGETYTMAITNITGIVTSFTDDAGTTHAGAWVVPVEVTVPSIAVTV